MGWMLESVLFPGGPSMYGVDYRLIVYMLLYSVGVFKNGMDKCLVKAGYT